MKEPRGHVIERKSEVPRFVVLLFGLAGLVALIILATLLVPRLLKFITNEQTPNENSTWLQAQWTQADHSAEEINTLAEILTDNGIKTVYVATNRWHGETGEFIVLPYTQNFLQRFRNAAPQVKVYTWLIVDPERLVNSADRQQVIDFATRAINEFGFNGVHLQARSVPDNSEDYIGLLRALRAAIGPQAILSVTVPPDRTPFDPDVPPSPVAANSNLTWSQEYKRRVALNVNEMVLMAHASGFSAANDYEKWLAYQVATYALLIEELEIEVAYIIALPTYPPESAHDPAVENPQTVINGVLAGMERARGADDQIDGVALYPWEETDLHELDTYWQKWVRRNE